MTPRIENQMTKRAPKRVADRPAEDNPRRRCAEKQEQQQLRILDAETELLDCEEGEIAGKAGKIGILRRASG